MVRKAKQSACCSNFSFSTGEAPHFPPNPTPHTPHRAMSGTSTSSGSGGGGGGWVTQDRLLQLLTGKFGREPPPASPLPRSRIVMARGPFFWPTRRSLTPKPTHMQITASPQHATMAAGRLADMAKDLSSSPASSSTFSTTPQIDLLWRIAGFLFRKRWETREAAALALEKVASVMDLAGLAQCLFGISSTSTSTSSTSSISDDDQDEEGKNNTKAATATPILPAGLGLLRYASLDMTRVLTDGEPLVASTGEEYQLDRAREGVSREELERQKAEIVKRLGLLEVPGDAKRRKTLARLKEGGKEGGVDQLAGFYGIGEEDLLAQQQQQEEEEEEEEEEEDGDGSSRRTSRRRRRKRKVEDLVLEEGGGGAAAAGAANGGPASGGETEEQQQQQQPPQGPVQTRQSLMGPHLELFRFYEDHVDEHQPAAQGKNMTKFEQVRASLPSSLPPSFSPVSKRGHDLTRPSLPPSLPLSRSGKPSSPTSSPACASPPPPRPPSPPSNRKQLSKPSSSSRNGTSNTTMQPARQKPLLLLSLLLLLPLLLLLLGRWGRQHQEQQQKEVQPRERRPSSSSSRHYPGWRST